MSGLVVAPKPEIESWFIFDKSTNEYGLPQEIIKDCLGLPYPVRDPRPVEGPLPDEAIPMSKLDREFDPSVRVYVPDSVTVYLSDSIKVLRLFERTRAADWYIELFGSSPHDSLLEVFDRKDGRLMPPRLMSLILPGIEDFDALDLTDN